MSTNTPIRTLSLSFDLPLYTRQLPRWRGAFVEMAGWENDRFHNHRNGVGKYYYRYPLIQYRVRRGKAALFAINEGVDALQQVLASCDWNLNWNGEVRPLRVEDLHMQEHDLVVLPHTRRYQLFKYLALNQENYERWHQAGDMKQRIQLLERLLRNHLLACLWGMGWDSDEVVNVQIQEIRRSQIVPFKGVPQLVFDLVYDANVWLPAHISLGKAVSHGFGWQAPLRRKRIIAIPEETRQAHSRPVEHEEKTD